MSKKSFFITKYALFGIIPLKHKTFFIKKQLFIVKNIYKKIFIFVLFISNLKRIFSLNVKYAKAIFIMNSMRMYNYIMYLESEIR